MEPPIAFDGRRGARREGEGAALAPAHPERTTWRRHVVRGQYGPRHSSRRARCRGYREEPDVAPDSNVETFVAMRSAVDNWRWGGVPFYVRAGKRLAKRVTEIAVQFKKVPHTLLPTSRRRRHHEPNVARSDLRIQPDEGIALRFIAKEPGQHDDARDVAMDFRYGAAFGSNTPEAYERLLLDAMRGDATLFTRADEVSAAWRFMTPVLEAWDESRPADSRTTPPAPGVPSRRSDLIERDGRAWRRCDARARAVGAGAQRVSGKRRPTRAERRASGS